MSQNQLVDKIVQWFVAKEFMLWVSENWVAIPELGSPEAYWKGPSGEIDCE